MNERELVMHYRNAKLTHQNLKESLASAQESLDKAEHALIELLESKDAKSTAKYIGVGYVTMVKPHLYARYVKDNETEVFAFVHSAGRGDMIKPTIHTQSLSNFVKDCIAEGKDVPEYIP